MEEFTNSTNTAVNNLVSPTGVSFMQKLGQLLPYSFNQNANSNKHLLKAYEESQTSGYENENSLSSINNAAAAYALYGRMIQQQVSSNLKALFIFVVDIECLNFVVIIVKGAELRKYFKVSRDTFVSELPQSAANGRV